MALTDEQRAILSAAGGTSDQNVRARACAVVAAQHGDDHAEAQRLIGDSYLSATAPSFHLIPRGEAMLAELAFDRAFEGLLAKTAGFTDVTPGALAAAVADDPAALAPLRMIAAVTYPELSVAIYLATGRTVSSGYLRALERGGPESEATRPRDRDRRATAIEAAAAAIAAIVGGKVLTVPPAVSDTFHSKVDRRDTRDGWGGVAAHARDGVPYSALLYQRYVGGQWRQVQDAYSEVKGDAVLELPLETLLQRERIPYYRAPSGATGAQRTSELYGLSPGPDFLIPPSNPQIAIESKVAEDGGTVRDKAARIQRLAAVCADRNIIVCAVVDGKGWSERVTALAAVVMATQGRTYSLSTLENLLSVPEIAAWIGKADG